MKRIVLAFLLSACTDPVPVDEGSVFASTEMIEPLYAPPDRIGDFCIVNGCDGQDYASVGGGDDQCQAMMDTIATCCLADNICHRGIRLYGGCFALEQAPPEETCPNDANGNGICVVDHVYYTRCD